MRGYAYKTSRWLALPYQGGATGGYARSAFSLAEIMIAIGIENKAAQNIHIAHRSPRLGTRKRKFSIGMLQK